jgi:GMP synthase (glutamine-hydrolysing)
VTPRTPHLVVVQHEDGCPLGRFDEWLGTAGARVSVVRPDRGEPLPTVGHLDGLIVLGGSMSATDDDRSPWLPAVRTLLGEAVGARLPTLGICLGHQLLAVASGGVVARNPAGKQLGVLPIGLRPPAADDALLAPLAGTDEPVSIQWNDDIVVGLPDGAVLLAATPAGTPQALRVGEWAWGVQFHPEVDAAIVRTWAEEHGPPPPEQVAALDELAERAGETEATGRVLATTFVGVASERMAVRS